jgi:hypothetical protein
MPASDPNEAPLINLGIDIGTSIARATPSDITTSRAGTSNPVGGDIFEHWQGRNTRTYQQFRDGWVTTTLNFNGK